MKYIVTWALMVSVACPDFKPNKYGQYPNTICAVMHWGKEEHSIYFNNRDSAFIFYNQAIIDRQIDVKLDSVLK